MVVVVFYAVGIRKNTILRNKQKYLAMIHKNRKISTVNNNGRFIRYICLGLVCSSSAVALFGGVRGQSRGSKVTPPTKTRAMNKNDNKKDTTWNEFDHLDEVGQVQ